LHIDSHAHLDGNKFDSDREQVLERARAAGLERILTIGSGTGPGTLDCAIRIAEQHEWIFASIGIHPHEAQLVTEADYTEMAHLASNRKVIAWGEIGLDYFYDHSPHEVQKAVFRRQMEQAREARLPIVIRCRPSNNNENTWEDIIEMLRQHWASSGGRNSALLYRRVESTMLLTAFARKCVRCRVQSWVHVDDQDNATPDIVTQRFYENSLMLHRRSKHPPEIFDCALTSRFAGSFVRAQHDNYSR
jgi:Tat protein secretion system quality control protein TatD with DNase activity